MIAGRVKLCVLGGRSSIFSEQYIGAAFFVTSEYKRIVENIG